MKARHWHPRAYCIPRARCGAWVGTAHLTRTLALVTCARCRQLSETPNPKRK